MGLLKTCIAQGSQVGKGIRKNLIVAAHTGVNEDKPCPQPLFSLFCALSCVC